MKAAAEAWGSKTNDFKRGFAKETHDPAIVAATMAKPGVVLRRPIGSKGAFSEHAALPKDPTDKVKERRTKSQPKTEELPARKFGEKAARDAALAFEREQKRRDIARRKEEAARERSANDASRQSQRRKGRLTKPSASTKPRPRRSNTNALHSTQAEDARWEKQKEKLEIALRRARD
jgi:colicin import membrane protein